MTPANNQMSVLGNEGTVSGGRRARRAFGWAAGHAALVVAMAVVGPAACRTLGSAGVSSTTNAIVTYLDGADLQAEQEQLGNVCKALRDLATRPRATLRAARYADYQGKTASWDLPTLLRAHFVPRSAADRLPDGEAFWAAVEDRGLRAVAQNLHARYRCSAMPPDRVPPADSLPARGECD